MLIIATFSIILIYSVSSETKFCQYRNVGLLPKQIFIYWSSLGCYIYNRPDQFNGAPLQQTTCNISYKKETYFVPGIYIDGNCIPFNYLDLNVTRLVEASFQTHSAFTRWITCCQNAKNCCENILSNFTHKDDECLAVWDGWSCYPSTKTKNIYKQICPQYVYTEKPPRCNHYSYKSCQTNAKWRLHTDYTNCDISPRLIIRTEWHIITLVVSILVCLPAAIVLIGHKNLQTQKYMMTRNLLIVIILRNFLVIIIKSTIIMDELTLDVLTTMQKNQWPCKVLIFFEKLLGNIVFGCMLLEGIYLHQLLTNVFHSRRRDGIKMLPFYISISIIVFGSAISWAIIMGIYFDKHCWLITEGTGFNWIFDVPRLLMLISNFFLFIHIIWALWKTFKHKESENHPIIRTVKASFLCLPLFGVQFFFLVLHPNTDKCVLEQTYYFIYYTVEALQGVSIALLHCYTDREVKKHLKGALSNFKDQFFVSNKKRNVTSITSDTTKRTTPTNNSGSNTSTSRSLTSPVLICTMHDLSSKRATSASKLILEVPTKSTRPLKNELGDNQPTKIVHKIRNNCVKKTVRNHYANSSESDI